MKRLAEGSAAFETGALFRDVSWSRWLVAAVLVVVLSRPLAAQTTWTGNGTDWSDNANWSDNAPNASSTTILYGSGSSQPTLTSSSAAGTLNMSGNTISMNGQSLAVGTMNLSGGSLIGTGTLNLNTLNMTGGSIGSSVGIFNNIAMNLTSSTLGGAISGVGTVNVLAGTAALNGANAYGGGTSVQTGATLAVGSNTALGTGTLNMATGATLRSELSWLSLSNNIALTGTNTIDTNGNATTLSGVLSGTAVTLNKIGAGTLTLSGTNTYSGTTNLNAGTLAAGNNAALGTSTLNMVTGTTLQSALSGLSLSNNIGLSGTNTIDTNGNATTLSGVLSGTAVTLNKNGTNALTLSGNNAYSGITNLNAGTLAAASNTALGSSTLNMGAGTSLQSARANLSLSNNIGLNGTNTIDTNGNATTLSGVISGSSITLNKIGTGTLTLSGSNTYSGTTDLSAGTLAVASNTALGTSRLNMAAGTTLQSAVSGLSLSNDIGLSGTNTIDTNGNSITLSGVISGNTAATLDKVGSGTMTLTGNNTFSGTTTISSGTLQIGNNSGTTGSLGGGDIVDNAALVFSRANTLTVANAISGTGSVTQAGNGTAILSGDNTYSGTTTISTGTLQIGNGGTSGTLGTGAVVATSILSFNRSDTLTVDNAISGGGWVTQAGSGTTILSGNNSYGVTTINAGTLQIGNGGTTGALGTGSVTNGSVLAFNRSNTMTVANSISGAGSVRQIGNGTTVLTGNNSYGATIIGAGILQVGNGGTSGTLGTGNVTNDAALAFNRSDTITVANAIGGAGAVAQNGAGTTILTGANTYTGGTTVNAGTLQLGANNALAAGSAMTVNGGTFNLGAFSQTLGVLSSTGSIVLGGGTLTFGDASDTNLTGLSGSGGLIKVGSGTVTVTGSNSFSGATSVGAGTLVVNGSIAGNVTVATGGTLKGTGTVGGLVVNNGGTIAPGNSIGTLNVTGNYAQNAGSTYQVEVNAAGQSDRINITGAATLNGGTVSVQAQNGTYQRNTTYTILSATGGVTGTYSGVTSNLAFLTPSLSYSGNAVMLSLLNTDNAFRTGAQSPNQAAVGGVLDQASPTATGDFASVLNALYGLDGMQGPKALDAISGQNYSGFGSVMTQGTQLFMDSFQVQAGGGGGSSYVALAAADCATACDTTPVWGVWGGGLGAFGTVAGNANASGITYNLGGFAAGLDRRFGNAVRVGVATGFNAASLYTQNMPGYGTSNTLQLALYGEYAEGPFYLDALAGYAHSDNRMTRPIVIPGLPFRSAQGYTTANTFFGQLETGYKLTVAPSFGGFVTPFARLQASTSTQNGFSETGADSLNLTVAAQTTQSLRTVFGAQLGAGIDAPWQEKLNLTLRLGWSHEYADLTRPVTASFAGAPALGFTTFGAVAPRDGVVLGLGANTRVAERTSVYLRYDGDLAGGNTNHVLSAGVRYVW